MPKRSIKDPLEIEDLLREEYFDLLPAIQRVTLQLETEVRSLTLPILNSLLPYEKLVVTSRVKACESALNTLLGKKEGRTFDPESPGGYSLLRLPDLAGVRVLAFPNSRLSQVDEVLRDRFRDWSSEPITDATGATQ